MDTNCTGCGTVLKHNLEIAQIDGLCPSCSSGPLLNPETGDTKGVGGCCVESVNGKTGVVVLTINDIDLQGNTFFTVNGARNAISGTAPIGYSPTTGIISHNNSGVATGSYGGASKTVSLTVNASGHITSITEHTITTGGVGPNVGAIEPLTGTGYLIRTGVNTWALRSINGSTGRIVVGSPNGVSAATTIDLAFTGVTAGTYGSSTSWPRLVIDAYGRITAIQNQTMPAPVVPSHTHALNDLSNVSVASPTTGHFLQWNGTAWIAAAGGGGSDNWGSQAVVSDSSLNGNGTSSSILSVVRPVPVLGSNGQVLTIAGGNMVWAAATGGSGDDWGAQVVASDATLTGQGTSSNQLKLAQQGATTGQVLNWNGTTWVPVTVTTGTVYNKQTTTANGSWQFCISPTATDPLFTGDMNNIQGVTGSNSETLVHFDSVFYLTEVEDATEFNDVQIGSVPALFNPLAEVVLPVGECLEGSTFHDQVPGLFTGTQRANLSVTIKTNGRIYLNGSTGSSYVATSDGEQSIIVPIFGSYFTKVT